MLLAAVVQDLLRTDKSPSIVCFCLSGLRAKKLIVQLDFLQADRWVLHLVLHIVYIIYHKSVTMYMHIVYIQYTLCEVLNEVPTSRPVLSCSVVLGARDGFSSLVTRRVFEIDVKS